MSNELIGITLALLAAACQGPLRQEDYRAQPPLSVSTETISLALPGGDRPIGENALKFARFINDYPARGVAPPVPTPGNAHRGQPFPTADRRHPMHRTR